MKIMDDYAQKYSQIAFELDFICLNYSALKTALTNSNIHKAVGRRLERPPEVVPAAGSIHGLWEFQELYQAKSWNGWERRGRQLCE